MDQNQLLTPFMSARRFVGVIGVAFTVLIGASLVWNVTRAQAVTLDAARIAARDNHFRDVIFRRWNTQHGGVYVPVTEDTQPNPYLTNVDEREITTPSGRLLTLINPAYMTRQVYELMNKEKGVQGHITSLNPIRPQNAPDAWEAAALQAFEQGEAEISSVEALGDGKYYMRLMRPLVTEKACLKCHAHQGYVEGDVRGGISVAIPMEPLWEVEGRQVGMLALMHGLLWAAGMAGIMLVGRRLRRNEQDLAQAMGDLRRARDAAEQANRAKSVFLSNMSHELRTPLNAILGFSQLMARDAALTEDQKENLDTIGRSGEHLLMLINEVLELSKIETGRMTLNETSFDLLNLLRGIEEMFRFRAESKGLDLIFEPLSDLPRYIRADEVKLRQILINLLGNAVKFTTQGGITLRIRHQDGGDEQAARRIWLHFEVEDTGPGIAEDELGQVFVPFLQTVSGKKAKEGTGLGMSISYQYARLMGGDLTVSSRLGYGTLFRLNVPVGEGDAKEISDDSSAAQVQGLEPGQPAYRILVVDDRDTSRRLLIKLLAPLGFELREAANGQEAVDLWRSWQPDLIWMDMRMPVMDGREATRAIRQMPDGARARIVALTASAFVEDRQAILDDGCDDFMRKPYRIEEIFEMLKKHLGVRFIYQNSRAAEGMTLAEDVDFDIETALCGLGEEWLKRMDAALVEADVEILQTLIDTIRSEFPGTAVALTKMVDNYQYDQLRQAIQQACRA